MICKRAYQLINGGKELPNILAPEVVRQGKFHPTVAWEHSKGRGLGRLGTSYNPDLHRVDIYWISDGVIYRDVGFTTISEASVHKYIEKKRLLWAKGVPVRGRPKGTKLVA